MGNPELDPSTTKDITKLMVDPECGLRITWSMATGRGSALYVLTCIQQLRKKFFVQYLQLFCKFLLFQNSFFIIFLNSTYLDFAKYDLSFIGR